MLGPYDFDPGGGTVTLTPFGNGDIFIAKYTAAGNYACAFNVGSADVDVGWDIAVDASANMYVTGAFYNTVDFDQGAGIANLVSTGTQDIFVAKYNNGCVIVLPVELVSFTAGCNYLNHVMLNWTTASENNSDYFTIERSADGKIFEEIGGSEGAGNSSTVLEYEFTDVSPSPFGEGQGVRYYRLRQTDYDGKYEYSPIASVRFPCQDEGVIILPNPSSGIFSVAGLSTNSEISVFNVMGEKVFSRKSNNEIITVDMADKSGGVYFIQIKTGKEAFAKKLIIQK